MTTRAARLATGWALTEGGLQRLQAKLEQTNPASTHVIETAGFSRATLPVVQEELKGSLRTFVVWEKRAQKQGYDSTLTCQANRRVVPEHYRISARVGDLPSDCNAHM